MPSGLIAGGLAALSLAGGAFVVVLGSGTAGPAATPSFNVDALPAAAQDYVPYLEQGGLACADVNAALLAGAGPSFRSQLGPGPDHDL